MGVLPGLRPILVVKNVMTPCCMVLMGSTEKDALQEMMWPCASTCSHHACRAKLLSSPSAITHEPAGFVVIHLDCQRASCFLDQAEHTATRHTCETGSRRPERNRWRRGQVSLLGCSAWERSCWRIQQQT